MLEFVEDNGLDQTEVAGGSADEASKGRESNSAEEAWVNSPPKPEGKTGSVSGVCG
jgi:hypothetical protein